MGGLGLFFLYTKFGCMCGACLCQSGGEFKGGRREVQIEFVELFILFHLLRIYPIRPSVCVSLLLLLYNQSPRI